MHWAAIDRPPLAVFTACTGDRFDGLLVAITFTVSLVRPISERDGPA